MDNGVQLEQLRDEVIKIARTCKEELAKPIPFSQRAGLSTLRPRETMNPLLRELLMLQIVDLQRREDGIYILEETERANATQSKSDIRRRSSPAPTRSSNETS
jgi:hypothetical protein